MRHRATMHEVVNRFGMKYALCPFQFRELVSLPNISRQLLLSSLPLSTLQMAQVYLVIPTITHVLLTGYPTHAHQANNFVVYGQVYLYQHLRTKLINSLQMSPKTEQLAFVQGEKYQKYRQQLYHHPLLIWLMKEKTLSIVQKILLLPQQ